MSDSWVADRIAEASTLSYSMLQQQVIRILLHQISGLNFSPNDRRLAFASAFDLLVSAEYYGFVTDNGWLTCSSNQSLILYPYTNICPQCIQNGDFVYHPANKPKSGVIGSITSKLLMGLVENMIHQTHSQIRVLRGKEPIDVIFIDETTHPVTVLFGEIKASPLITFPLSVPLNEHANSHTVYRLDAIENSMSIFLSSRSYPLGNKSHPQDTEWATRGLLNLLQANDNFLIDYFNQWRLAFNAYSIKNHIPSYWLTNGCGQPIPRSTNWLKRADGGGYESVSDSKTSVGMDRTDDIKKGIYQIFNLSVLGKSSPNYAYKVGLISNIHAVRHYDDYLSQFADIMWSHEQSDVLFNLFDGIIALTQTHARDEWVKQIFDF